MNATIPIAGPWGSDDVIRWAATTGVGLAVLCVAWFLLSGHASVRGQIPAANLAVAGVVIASYGQFTFLVRGRRALTGRSVRVQLSVASRRAPTPDHPAATSGPLVGGPGLHYYHRPECQFARGRDWAAQPLEADAMAGRVPCGACWP